VKPVDQTLFGEGAGNCFAACVASILGMPLVSVPNFCVEHGDDDWYGHFSKWLNDRGLAPLTMVNADEHATAAHLCWARQFAADVHWIASGDTARGKHAVVYVGGRLAHDPNPNYGRAGLTRIEDATFFLSRNISGEQPSC
jgi:hypothetical protein